jgi:hypothetical protein
MRGFANGDGVLVLGTAAPGGITAREVYGGTLAQYVVGLRTMQYVWLAAAVLSVIGGVVAEWADQN